MIPKSIDTLLNNSGTVSNEHDITARTRPIARNTSDTEPASGIGLLDISGEQGNYLYTSTECPEGRTIDDTIVQQIAVMITNSSHFIVSEARALVEAAQKYLDRSTVEKMQWYHYKTQLDNPDKDPPQDAAKAAAILAQKYNLGAEPFAEASYLAGISSKTKQNILNRLKKYKECGVNTSRLARIASDAFDDFDDTGKTTQQKLTNAKTQLTLAREYLQDNSRIESSAIKVVNLYLELGKSQPVNYVHAYELAEAENLPEAKEAAELYCDAVLRSPKDNFKYHRAMAMALKHISGNATILQLARTEYDKRHSKSQYSSPRDNPKSCYDSWMNPQNDVDRFDRGPYAAMLLAIGSMNRHEQIFTEPDVIAAAKAHAARYKKAA